MRDFNDRRFNELLAQIHREQQSTVKTYLNSNDLNSLYYFLVKNLYYPTIVDDYPFEIIDKEGLLEALYFQTKLITVHDLNWDAIQEGMSDALNSLNEFNGIILMFRNAKNLIRNIPSEFKMLSNIVEDIGKQPNQKIIKILI